MDMEVVCNADLWELERRIKNEELEARPDPRSLQGPLRRDRRQHPDGRASASPPSTAPASIGIRPWAIGRHALGETIANALFAHMEYTKDREWILNTW